MQDYYYSNVFCPQHHSHCQHHWPMEKSLDASTLCYVAFQHHGSHHCHWQGQQWLSFLGWRWPRIQYSLVALAIVFQRLQQKQVRSRTSPSLNLCHGLCRPLQGSNSNNNILQQLQQQPWMNVGLSLPSNPCHRSWKAMGLQCHVIPWNHCVEMQIGRFRVEIIRFWFWNCLTNLARIGPTWFRMLEKLKVSISFEIGFD